MFQNTAADITAQRADRNAAAARYRASADRAAQWLLNRIDDHGAPQGAEQRNSWWRVPWALTVGGHRGAASSLLSWAERTSITDEGDLVDGAAGGGHPVTPVYQLSHLALAAHLLNRFDTAELLYQRIVSTYYNDKTGGVYFYRDPATPNEDILFTAQLGLISTLMGHLDVAHQVFGWFERLWQAQPELDQLRLYTTWRDGTLLREETPLNLVDFTKERQFYFQPGGAAAFLGDYAARTGRREPIEIATGLMRLNVEGTPRQFDDPDSVHICKFGWGAAEMLTADPSGDWERHATRMGDWFVDRQRPDGAWDPSLFTLTAEPTDLDRMWKTAEHLMEIAQIEVALRGVPRGAAS